MRVVSSTEESREIDKFFFAKKIQLMTGTHTLHGWSRGCVPLVIITHAHDSSRHTRCGTHTLAHARQRAAAAGKNVPPLHPAALPAGRGGGEPHTHVYGGWPWQWCWASATLLHLALHALDYRCTCLSCSSCNVVSHIEKSPRISAKLQIKVL